VEEDAGAGLAGRGLEEELQEEPGEQLEGVLFRALSVLIESEPKL
jgi:hypothetical protein